MGSGLSMGVLSEGYCFLTGESPVMVKAGSHEYEEKRRGSNLKNTL